ncbi:hypothetical protein Bhyg_08361 [Pseudolycoriella hygida]|uniref:Uncharacterized protein n=1 Tax=Pseudolycoriella hygida TaxID=35572 RepID=A0A9Q0N4K9_9DIPT|nr:hypothetical protein Bhyg_08361 [Pseudolycoriella hygida]
MQPLRYTQIRYETQLLTSKLLVRTTDLRRRARSRLQSYIALHKTFLTLSKDRSSVDTAEYFEDEDTYPNDYDDDDEVSDESRDESVDEQESREEEIRKPENIDSILKAHGGSLNLKEITNVKASTAKNCFLIKNGNGEAVSIKKNNSAGFSATNIKN